MMRPGLHPDNFIVTPQIAVTPTSVFTFFVCSDWYAYIGEHYGVAISTAGNTDPSDFITIAEWTLEDKNMCDNDQGPWHEHNIDLSEYAGQNIYIAIRHFYCTNIYRIDIDDISVTTEEGGCDAPANFNGIGASLYPNPSSGAFNIDCHGMTRITVYGMRGETIMDASINADSYVITSLNAGVYFIRIETAEGSMTQKIVKL